MTAKSSVDSVRYDMIGEMEIELPPIEEQFKFKDNDGLELITTVDKAIVELNKEEKDVSLSNVKHVIKSHPEWEEKLDRNLFSDENIEQAIKDSCQLFY